MSRQQYRGGRGRGRYRGRGGRGGQFDRTKKRQSNQEPSQNDLPKSAYRFCSKKECEERQSLLQIHQVEATFETSGLPQAQRILDPSLAVSKYKRPAAGSEISHRRSKATLIQTLQHLRRVCATRQATRKHVKVERWQDLAEFLVDRLRACQADATRSFSTTMPVAWHVEMIRLLLWIRYWTLDDWMQKIIPTMLSTAFESYWTCRQYLKEDSMDKKYDDEVLCLSALFQVSRVVGSSSSYSNILLEYSKLVDLDQNLPISTTYPLWHKALRIVSHLSRQEYMAVWKMRMPILAKCCLEPALFHWRCQTLQQYNKSFAKQEAVSDIQDLFLIHPQDWSLEYAREFGLPVEQREDQIVMILKQSPMDPQSKHHTRRDHHWVFQEFHDSSPMGLADAKIESLLQKGYVKSIEPS